MKPLLRTTSIKGALSWVVMLICSITLFASLTISSLQDINFQKKKLVDQLHAYANIVAFNSKASILYDDAEMEAGRLKSFAAVDILHNIHIYKLTAETNQLSFFSSYNRRDVGPHPTQFDKVDELLEPHFDGDVIEIAKAVDFEGKKIGYIYLRASLDDLNKYMQNRILYDLLIAVIALIGAFFVSVRLQRRFTKPIETLLSVVQKVTKEKSYSMRAPAAEIEELHMLGRAINNMLDRIEQQFNKVQQAELEIRQLNQGLGAKNQRTHSGIKKLKSGFIKYAWRRCTNTRIKLLKRKKWPVLVKWLPVWRMK